MTRFLSLLSDWLEGRAPRPHAKSSGKPSGKPSVQTAGSPFEKTPAPKSRFSEPQAGTTAAGSLRLHPEALTFETARIGLALESEARAWRAAKGLGLLLALETAAVTLMLPLKTTVPYVIELDRETGAASILEVSDGKPLPASDIQDKYWLSQYVLARESYDYRTLENDYIKVRELSLPQVFEPYASQFGDKADSLEKRLGDAKQYRIELVSVVPNGNGIATVRFRKTVRNTASGLVESESRWTATLGYEYRPQKKVPESTRLVNPFGFRVTSYRADEEIGKDQGPDAQTKGSAPAAAEATEATEPAATPLASASPRVTGAADATAPLSQEAAS